MQKVIYYYSYYKKNFFKNAHKHRCHIPCLLQRLRTRLIAADLGHVAARGAVDGRIGYVAHWQEVGS